MNKYIFKDKYIELHIVGKRPAIVLISYESYNLVKTRCWGLTNYGYIISGKNIKNRQIFLHNLIIGSKPVDHINMNRLDNRLENLRRCTMAQNSMNRNIPANNTCGYTGVSIDKRRNKYVAYIKLNGKRKHLGQYEQLKDAIIARIRGEIIFFKEFCNFSLHNSICAKYNISKEEIYV